MRPATLLSGLASALLLAACGGGGSSSDSGTGANQPPVASARLVGEAVLGATTRFDDSASSDPDGSIASVSWDYGDGQTGTQDSHVYAATGSYTATLTVTDNRGATDATAVAVTVARCSAAGTSAATTAQGAGRAAVCMQTSLGEMVMELYTAQAPVTSANFLRYVDDGFFTDTLFHRVIAGFVIQGGGFVSGMVAKPATYPAIPLEVGVGLSNTRYTVAMARTNDLNSATSQFYVNLVDNVPLDTNAGGYAVFGKVISGTAVVDAIGAVATGTTNGFADVPRQDIVVTSAVRMP